MENVGSEISFLFWRVNVDVFIEKFMERMDTKSSGWRVEILYKVSMKQRWTLAEALDREARNSTKTRWNSHAHEVAETLNAETWNSIKPLQTQTSLAAFKSITIATQKVSLSSNKKSLKTF
jgi:hypothetical protein